MLGIMIFWVSYRSPGCQLPSEAQNKVFEAVDESENTMENTCVGQDLVDFCLPLFVAYTSLALLCVGTL